MKKLVLSILSMLVIIFPLIAQQQVTEEIPVESLILKKANIPPAVSKSADSIFIGNTQVRWGVFPYELKDYGWVVNKDYNEPINHYMINLKAKDGSDIYAVFESTGQLIRYRMVNKNAIIPESIKNALAKSDYKDWKITGDTEIVKNNQKKVVEHYIVKLEKDNKKKALYYNLKGEQLTNKS
jgi:hypothetical protein